MKAVVCNKCLTCVTDIPTAFAVKIGPTVDPPHVQGEKIPGLPNASIRWFHLCNECEPLFAKFMRTKGEAQGA